MSLYGQCADFDAINQVAQKYNLPVIKDAEEGLRIQIETWVDGSSPYDLVPTGRIGVGAELVTSHVLRLMPGRELVSASLRRRSGRSG